MLPSLRLSIRLQHRVKRYIGHGVTFRIQVHESLHTIKSGALISEDPVYPEVTRAENVKKRENFITWSKFNSTNYPLLNVNRTVEFRTDVPGLLIHITCTVTLINMLLFCTDMEAVVSVLIGIFVNS